VRRPSPWFSLLYPFSILYSAVVRAKALAYSRGIFRGRKLPGTVISVGNLTVGGTGKTPMVLAIAEKLSQDGKHTAILTRGYRGIKAAGEGGVSQSDEVALLREHLAGTVQLGVGASRYKNGLVLSKHGVEWFVLDDGFQHRKLFRDVDIVLVDAMDPFGGKRVLPSGRLREPLSALKRADIVVITRSLQTPAPALESILRRYTDRPIFYAFTKLKGVSHIPQMATSLPEQDWREARFLAFCAIGNPDAFFTDLRAWGLQALQERSFADHHLYTPSEAAELEQAASVCGADALLCTEKDVWNLRNVKFEKLPVYCCRISVELPEAFWTAISETVQRRKSGAAQ
jgi:tetraacyldisaccharide 4'-kinase